MLGTMPGPRIRETGPSDWRILADLRRRWAAERGVAGQERVELAGEVPLEAAEDLELRSPLCRPPCDVRFGLGIHAPAHKGDHPQGAIRVAISAAVHPMPLLTSRRRILSIATLKRYRPPESPPAAAAGTTVQMRR